MIQIPAQRNQLITIFLEHNSQINLSAIRDPEGVYVKHILDSLELLKVLDLRTGDVLSDGGHIATSREGGPSLRSGGQDSSSGWHGGSSGGQKVADIGTGGGFPLLPLAMSFPEISFTGIDSVRKKIQAIFDITETLKLTNVSLVRNRIEDMDQQFDIVTARAVAHVEKLIPRAQSLLKKGSKLVLYKEYKQEEKTIMLELLKAYRMTLLTEHQYMLFSGDIQRVIYILQKN